MLLSNQNSDIWGLADYCRSKQVEYQDKGMHSRRMYAPGKLTSTANDDSSVGPKRLKLTDLAEEDASIITKNIAFFRSFYAEADVPKMRLHTYALKNGIKQPTYETKHEDRLFRSILTFNGSKFASTYWEKNKRYAEQSAALVCLLHLGHIDEEVLIKNGSILK